MHNLMLLVLTEDTDLIQMLSVRLKGAGATNVLVQQAVTLGDLPICLAERDYQACLVDLRLPAALQAASWLTGFAMVLAWSPRALAPQQHAALSQAGVHAVLLIILWISRVMRSGDGSAQQQGRTAVE